MAVVRGYRQCQSIQRKKSGSTNLIGYLEEPE
jgi:hypothetical protein